MIMLINICLHILERGLFDRKIWYGIDGIYLRKLYFYKRKKYNWYYFKWINLNFFSCGKGIIITKAIPFIDKKIILYLLEIKNLKKVNI
jgi:hypothetical protein